jgi:copper chaperone
MFRSAELGSTSPHHQLTTMQTETMNVTGMTCGGCVGKVTKALKAVPGVGHVDVSLPGKASIDFDEKLTSRERLQSAVKAAGYGVAAGKDAAPGRTKGGCCG